MAIHANAKRRRLTISLSIFALVATMVPLIAAPAGAQAAFIPGTFVSPTLEGCKGDTTAYVSGTFRCADAQYTTGNLGKGWDELDLVPHRLTTKLGSQDTATTTYDIIVAADNSASLGGFEGYDIISSPTKNTALSHASCQVVSVGAQGERVGITGGVYDGIFRIVRISQDKGTTCVFDWYQRLSLTSAEYSGSSLQSYIFEKDDFSTGKRTVPIPLNEVQPQVLDKTMTAAQGGTHTWNLVKGAEPTSWDFGCTCETNNTDPKKTVTVTVEWTKLPISAGKVRVDVNVYATNPARRPIEYTISDKLFDGPNGTGTQIGTGASFTALVPKETQNFLFDPDSNPSTPTYSFEIDVSGADKLGVTWSDIAKADLKDPVFNSAIGTLTVTKDAVIQAGTILNGSAVITDIESIFDTGGKLSFSVDAVANATGTLTSGGNPYTLGTATKADVKWVSSTQTGTGKATFTKTVYLDGPAAVSDGKLSDSATLAGSNGFAAGPVTAETTFTSVAKVDLKIKKTIPNVLQGTETASFSFDVIDAGNNKVGSVTIVFAAGETSKTGTVPDLNPGATYTVKETSVSGGFGTAANVSVTINDPTGDPSKCSQEITITNNLLPTRAKVKKVTVPAGNEAGWEFKLQKLNGTWADVETKTTMGTGFVFFDAVLDEGQYRIVETLKTGFEFTSKSGCEFTVNLPADGGTTFECTYTNTQQGRIIVRKKAISTTADLTTVWFEFETSYDDVSGADFALRDYAATNDQDDSGYLSPNKTYTVEELAKAGWDLTKVECNDNQGTNPRSNPASLVLDPAETIVCTFTNTERGMVTVYKTVDGVGSGGWKFEIRTGASTTAAGTILQTRTTDATGNATFDKLQPGTYQFCETEMMPGWMNDFDGFTPLGATPEGGDNSTECIEFTLAAGQTKAFTVNNTPPPGGDARTIGFWKNWTSCDGHGNQAAVLDQTLVAAGGTILLGNYSVSTCPVAVDILDKRDVKNPALVGDGQKKAGDAVYGMAAQLLAAKLNLAAQAGSCPALTTAISQADALLAAVSYNATGDYLKGGKNAAALRAEATRLAGILDSYNNNTLCP